MQIIRNFLRRYFTPSHAHIAQQSPILAKNLQILEGRMRGVMQFLRKTPISRQYRSVKLSRLPWYLLIGAPGAGKTALLKHANVHFVLDKKAKRENVRAMPQAEMCDWWATKDVVLVDVPGSYITPNSKSAAQPFVVWHTFLDLLTAWRGQTQLQGVVVTLSITELLNKQQRDNTIHHLRRRIIELREKFGEHLPFYLLITKCDLLPGFVNFFSDCTSDEMSQAWGITLPPAGTQQETLTELFTQRFNGLIKRLNQQLIARLHHERDAFVRTYIKDFPFQVENVKEACMEALKLLTQQQTPFALKGVFLTSALQDTTMEGAANQPPVVLSNEFQQSLQIMQSPTQPAHPYFIKQFILHALAPKLLANRIFSNG